MFSAMWATVGNGILRTAQIMLSQYSPQSTRPSLHHQEGNDHISRWWFSDFQESSPHPQTGQPGRYSTELENSLPWDQVILRVPFPLFLKLSITWPYLSFDFKLVYVLRYWMLFWMLKKRQVAFYKNITAKLKVQKEYLNTSSVWPKI